MATATIGDNTGNTYSGTEDAELKQSTPTTNIGSDATPHTHKYGVGDHATYIIKFSGLSNIIGPVTVSAATLYVWQLNEAIPGSTYDVRLLFRDWVENQATWSIYSTGNIWATNGAEGNVLDRSNTVSASLTTDGSNGLYRAFTGAGLIANIEGKINGSVSNYGWLIERNGTGNDSNYITFAGSEGTDGQRPYLSITYAAAASNWGRMLGGELNRLVRRV